jgi:glycosyltransferase involved in cell wall biosynthesis
MEERGEVKEKRKLSILLINNYFPPEIGAASHLYFYLARELSKRGHEVTVLTGIPRYNIPKETYNQYLRRMKNKKFVIENISDCADIEVIRVRLPYIERHQLLRRGVEHFEIALKMFSYAKEYLRNKRVDVSLVYSPPITLYKTAWKVKRLKDAPFVLNVQDLFPQAAIDLGILKNPLLIRLFKQVEKKAYQLADLITVHSERNKEFVKSVLNGDGRKVLVMENWVDENEIKPGDKINDFSIKHGLTEKFVVSFAGTLGFSQDMEVIIRAANELKEYKDIVFIIVGNGVRLEESKKLAESLNLQNIRFIPSVPREIYPLVLHSSDVSLATLTKDVKTPVVPSKILSIMSAGIPVIAVMNLEGDAPKLVEKANAGFAIPAGDYKSLAEKILLLYKNPELRESLGRNGRRYIEENLSSRKAAEKYEKIFLDALRRDK